MNNKNKIKEKFIDDKTPTHVYSDQELMLFDHISDFNFRESRVRLNPDYTVHWFLLSLYIYIIEIK